MERPGETEQDLAYYPYLRRPHSRYREPEAGGSQFPKKEDYGRLFSGGDQEDRLRLMSRRIARSAVWWRRRELNSRPKIVSTPVLHV